MFHFLRVVSGLLILAVLLQAITMGLYLSGHDSMLSLHRTGSILTAGLAVLQVVAALLYFSRNRSASPILATSVGMLVAVILQMSFGFAHNVAIHIPLGVVIFGGLARLGMLVAGEAPKPDAVAVPEKAEAA